jgi:hypothetical protein
METEEKLKYLFDRQRFSRNARLQKIIEEAMDRSSMTVLTEDELAGVAAAGDLDAMAAFPEERTEQT